MALTFPLAVAAFADTLPIKSLKWRLWPNQNVSGLGSGQIYGKDVAPQLWRGEVVLDKMPNGQADQIASRIESLDGPMKSFYLYSPSRIYPQADPTGAYITGATPVIESVGSDNRSLALSAMPALYTLTHGDFLAFDYGTPARRAFHRIAEQVASDGTGVTPEFAVNPALETGVAEAIEVTLVKPACLVFVTPDSFDPGEVRHALTYGMRFSVMQRLA